MGFSSWICSKSSSNMFVKIVHPGGHVELHDRPILAAEIIYRNPRCVVAHPHVFKQPWAIVKPETELMLGQKFYVVPVSTIRKLQRVSKKCSTNSLIAQTPLSKSQKSEEKDPDSDDSSICWFFTKKNSPRDACINHLDDEGASANTIEDDESCFSNKNCFKGVKTGVRSTSHRSDSDDSGEKTLSPSNFKSSD
ncbi:hypothetical protein PTKIN_Ptkin18bG0033100 [Pterospermum kingtungense]